MILMGELHSLGGGLVAVAEYPVNYLKCFVSACHLFDAFYVSMETSVVPS